MFTKPNFIGHRNCRTQGFGMPSTSTVSTAAIAICPGFACRLASRVCVGMILRRPHLWQLCDSEQPVNQSKCPTFQDPEFPPNDNSLGKLKGDTVPWPKWEQAATGAVVLWYTGLRRAEAGGYVHQGGGTEWIKASEIAEKDRFVAEELRSPSTCR